MHSELEKVESPELVLDQLDRPEKVIVTYAVIFSLCFGPFCIFVFPYLMLRYRTLHYRVDADRITSAWGKLTHHEVSVAFERVQDIHLHRNLIHRMLGLARIEIQTAGGDANAEIKIEGFRQYEALRVALFERVQAARRKKEAPHLAEPDANTPEKVDELTQVLLEVRDELRALRGQLANQTQAEPQPSQSEQEAKPKVAP